MPRRRVLLSAFAANVSAMNHQGDHTGDTWGQHNHRNYRYSGDDRVAADEESDLAWRDVDAMRDVLDEADREELESDVGERGPCESCGRSADRGVE